MEKRNGKTGRIPQKRLEQIRALYCGERPERVYRKFVQKQVVLAFAAALFFPAAGLLSGTARESGTIQNGSGIERPGYGEPDKEVDVLIHMQDGTKELNWEKKILVPAREYGEAEWKQAVSAAQDYIDQTVAGENASLEHVTKPLFLAEKIPGLDVRLFWEREEGGIIGPEGEIMDGELPKQGKAVTITAVLQYRNWEARYPVYLRAYPREPSWEEEWRRKLDDALQKAQGETRAASEYFLPGEAGKVKIAYTEKKEERMGALLILGTAAALAAGLCAGRDWDRKMRIRERQLLLDYPALIHKFSLLLNAGMTVSRAWEKIVTEYLGKREKRRIEIRYAYEEMAVTMREIKNGVPERQAFEDFGKRIRLLPYQRWSSLLEQNRRKGTAGLANALELEALSAEEERKELARRLGEEAGTKLLFPMLLMLLIVLVITMVPAFRTF